MYNDDIDNRYNNNNNDNDNDIDNIYVKLTGLWTGAYINSFSDNNIHSNKQLNNIFLSFSKDGVLEGLGIDENNLPFTINGNILPQGEVSFNLRSTDRCVAFSGQCDMIKQIHGSTFTADIVIKKISDINCENICKLLQTIGTWNIQITGNNNITKCINNINLSFNIGKWKKEEYYIMMLSTQSSNINNKNLIHMTSENIYDQNTKDTIIICSDLDLKSLNVSLVMKKSSSSKIEKFYGILKPSKLEIDVKGSGFCQIQFTCNGKFQQSLRRTPNLISLCIKNNKNIHNTDYGIINDEKVDNSNYSRSNNKPDDLEHDILQNTIDNNNEDENDCDSKFQISQISNNTIEIKKTIRSLVNENTENKQVLTYDSFDQRSDDTYVKLLNKSIDSDDDNDDDETTLENNIDILNILNGVWCGFSCSDPSSISTYTIWRDMNLITNNDFNPNKIDGNGISEWRGHNIPYTIDIEFNNKNDTIEDLSSFIMTKTHKGKFKNAIKYKCHVVYIHNTYVMQFLSTFENLEKSSEKFEIKLSCDDGTKSDYATCIIGNVYGTSNISNNGTVRLIKVSEDNVDVAWYSWLAVFRDGQQVNSDIKVTNNEQIVNTSSIENKDDNNTIICDDISSIYGSTQRNLSVKSDNHSTDDSEFQKISSSSNNNDNNILRYRLLVSELLMSYSNGNAISMNNIKLLEEFRNVHDVSNQEHEQILASLGWTNEKLLEILSCNSKLSDDENNINEYYCVTCKSKAITNDDSIDANKCRVCYESQIDCILLPCAHFAVCMVCALKMDNCPFDRTKIIKIQQIFRVT